jgi:hypothetical protein
LSAPGQHVRLQFPVLPPEEYDLKVVMTRTEGNDGIAFGLAQPSAQWTVFVDKFPQEGSQSGLEMVDNGMLTLVRGGQVQNNVPITFEFKVRRGSFSVLKDGKAFLQWQGNSSRLSNFPRWVVKNPRALFLGQWENRLRYTEIKLTAVSGEGRLLRGGAAVPAPAVPKGSVDLLALIDPAKDAVKGEWTKDSSGLDCPAGNHIRLQIPYAPPDEYDLTIVANRKEGSDGLLVGLAKGDVQWAVTMDTQSSGTFKSGFESLDNRGPNDNATTYAAPVFTNGAEITLEFQVRKAGVTVIAGGKRIIEWKGSFNRLSLPDGWKVKNPNALFLAAWGSHYQFSRISLTPVSGTGSPLRKAAPQANGVDLLKMIEPRRDGQRGTWRFSEGALIADGHSASVHMRLDIPYVPPAEYDLIAVVEKEDQEISGDFFVVLPGGGRSCSFSMDGFGGTVSGIFDLDGKNPREGPSRVEGPFFKPGIARTITYSVRKDSLTVRADGQDFYSWKGNWNRVSVNAAMGGGGKIGVGTLSCVYHIKKLVLVPVVR